MTTLAVISTAASSADATGGANVASMLTMLIPLALIIVFFYFFIIRPEKKRNKEMQNMLNSIQVADEVITNGGIIGRVLSVKEDTVLIETGSDRTKIRVLKSAIAKNNTVHEAPAEEAAPAEEQAAPAAEGEEVEVPINIEENAKVKAAVDYLKDVIEKMGVQDVKFSAVQKGEATIIRLDGEKMGALIGRRGETMESLSYLASLVANRLEGDYIKLGLDVAGYRDKRESDLTALAQRIGAKVRRTGRSFAMEPMNPYERRIIHSAIGKMEGVRSESKGEGRDRRVVIYSTDPNAVAESANARPRGPRGGRDRNGNGRNGGYHRGGERRGDRNGRGPRNGSGRGGYRSNVPERTYTPRDAENAAPVAPKRTERVDDFADLSFGKIEL